MATAIDPICKMEVDTDNPNGGSSEYQGTTYYFCAPGCKVAFDGEPEKYLGSQWLDWTCPTEKASRSRDFSPGCSDGSR